MSDKTTSFHVVLVSVTKSSGDCDLDDMLLTLLLAMLCKQACWQPESTMTAVQGLKEKGV